MPRTLTMSTIRTRCKRRADQENSSFIADAEWNALISEKWGELHGLVCETGSLYFATTATITATGATSYNEPTDHMETVRLYYVYSDSRQRDLRRLHPSEVAGLAGTTGDAYNFFHLDDQIYLYPNPSSGTYKHLYLPQATDLSSYADGDSVDVMTADGEAALVWGVAAVALAKNESDPTFALNREEYHKRRLEYWAARRAIGDGRRPVADEIDPDLRIDEASLRLR